MIPISDVYDVLTSAMTSVAAAATIAALAATAQQALRSRRSARPHSEREIANESQLDLQIKDIRAYLQKQEAQAGTNGFLNVVLNISQYGVGAALVTSFVAENLPAQMLGLLGIITLLSSFMQQLVRPDVRRLQARRRVVRLQEMLRRAEIAVTDSSGRANQSELQLEHARAFLSELHSIQRDEAD